MTGKFTSRGLFAFAASVAFVLGALAAHADGLPYRGDSIKDTFAPPPFSWTGFYIGLNAGTSWGQTDVDYRHGSTVAEGFGADPVTGGTGPRAFSSDLSPNGFIGGAQIGYNFQAGNWVYGIEFDFQGRDFSDSDRVDISQFDSLVFNQSQDWLSTLRGRLGYAADNWLFYATAGLAFGQSRVSVTQNGIVPGVPDIFEQRLLSDTDTKTGWTAGGGIDYGVGRWIVGVEYLFVDLGDSDTRAHAIVTPGLRFFFPEARSSFDDTSHILRAKLSYRFN